MGIAKTRRADLLFPTQEQVTMLSAREKCLSVPTIVPPFSALRLMQDKISVYRTLAEIGAPQPQTIAIAIQAISGVSQPFPFRQTADQHGEFGRATSQDTR